MIPDAPLLRLALITRRYPPLIGGAEKVLSYLAPALAAEGAEVTVLTARPSDLARPGSDHDHAPGHGHAHGHGARPPGYPASFIDPPAVETVALPDDRERRAGRLTIRRLPSSPQRFLGTWLYMRQLRGWLERNPVDLAYVSMLKHDAYVAVGVGKERDFPVVLRPEGAGATGDIAWQSWGRFGRRIGRRCREADAIVAISAEITAELAGAGYDPAAIVALPNGVPVPDAPWRPRPDWGREPRAVYVGRLAPEKGLDLLVNAWPLVRARSPRARLILIGDGPERPALIARIAHLDLADSVEMPGALANPTPRLREADLFVLPSREEGMSIALLEAMALGLPLVASAIPGNRHLIADGEHGRLAPVHDPAAWSRAILDQWDHFDHAVQMARAARQRVAREHAIDGVARKHLDLFHSLIEEHAQRPRPFLKGR